MDGYIAHGPVELPRGSFVLIEDGRGMDIELWDGSLWITQEADTRDYMVKADTRFHLEREGLVIACAMRPSRITLTAPVPAYYARRIVLTHPERAMRVLYQRGLGHRLMRGWTRLWSELYAPACVPTTAGP